MATRTIHLATFRQTPKQRAHFSIFIPSPGQSDIGTIIHVVGAPMVGYTLEFKRNYSLSTGDQPLDQYIPIGEVAVENIVDFPPGDEKKETSPKGKLEIVATQVPPPRISQNFLAPVNDTTNRRCQEWTMDFVRRLVQIVYIGEEAIEVVQAKRDASSHGIGLQPVRRV